MGSLGKCSENSKNITEARDRFLIAHNVTAEIYAKHEGYMKEFQKWFDSLGSRLTMREFVNVKILKGNSPKELFVMKVIDEKLAAEFHQQLEKEYSCTKPQCVLYLKEGIICVARSQNGWHRCRIIRLHENGTCDALLIDIGITERIDWNDLRIIDGKFRPSSIRCSLRDFPALAIQCHLVYVLTGERIEHFSLSQCQHFQDIMLNQSDFFVYAHRPDDVSDIFLYYKFGDEFHCVNNIFTGRLASDDNSSDYFRSLFLIKGSLNNRSDISMQQIVHKQLMQSLYKPRSFFALCEALLPSITSLDQDEEIVKKRLHCCEVISSIIARRGHKEEFYMRIIEEIHQHIIAFIQSKKSHQLYYTDVGVQCLNKLCSLQKAMIDQRIKHLFFDVFERMAEPNDLIAGAVICESDEFLEAVHAVHLTFCASGPSHLTLPSDFLSPYIPLLVQLQHTINDSTNKPLKEELKSIIIRCLSNREKTELNQIIERILYDEVSDEGTKRLHPRIQIRRTIVDGNERITFNIAPVEDGQHFDNIDVNFCSFINSSSALLNVLKHCNHNVLIYNIFLHLLEIFSDIFEKIAGDHQEDVNSTTSSSSELLSDENELQKLIEHKFKKKYVVIYALNELILFKSFHGQFAENPHDIILVLEKILNQQIKQIQSAVKSNRAFLTDNHDEVLIVILSIVGDLKIRIQNDELKGQLNQTLETLRSLILNIDEQNKVLKMLDSVLDSNSNFIENNPFQEAKAILSDALTEPYFKVYGIVNMTKLLSSRDEETCLNSHTVLALALKLLRDQDSYVFLNCIKLLVALFEILKDTVLNALISEYHFDIDADTADIDFNLKIGETIIKVTEGVGEMCYKYKDTLINCFLRGSYNKHKEFRTSSMANLGVIMRILCYQVHHIFQEVMLLIQNILQCDTYLPARRAAALVLSDLLNGMSNLEDFQDFLIPIYQTLKHIKDNDSDLHVKIHATNGLECLKDKIKEALSKEVKIEKKISIFDVKNNEKPIRYK